MLKQAAITVKAGIPFALREAVRALQPQLTKARSTAVSRRGRRRVGSSGVALGFSLAKYTAAAPATCGEAARTRDGGVAGHPTVLGHPGIPSTISIPPLARLANRFPCGGAAHPRSADVYIGTVVAKGSKATVLPRLTGSLRSSVGWP